MGRKHLLLLCSGEQGGRGRLCIVIHSVLSSGPGMLTWVFWLGGRILLWRLVSVCEGLGCDDVGRAPATMHGQQRWSSLRCVLHGCVDGHQRGLLTLGAPLWVVSARATGLGKNGENL